MDMNNVAKTSWHKGVKQGYELCEAFESTGIEPKQPAPTLNNNPSVHDLVIIDLIHRTDGNRLLAKGIWDRKAIGLKTYGTPLQAFNGRDCEQDAVEEILDYICYLKQSLLEGKSYLEPIYHRSIALAIDQMNLSYVNSGGEIEGQCLI